MVFTLLRRDGDRWLIVQTGIDRRAAVSLALRLEGLGHETRIEPL